VPSFAKQIEGFAEGTAEPLGHDDVPWWMQGEGTDYLCVVIRDAKDLAILDLDFHSAST
jgi:hypothetical protein